MTLSDAMLINRFWDGLREELKEATRRKAETVTDFDQLRIEVRKIECQKAGDRHRKPSTTKAQVKVTTVQKTDALEQVAAMLGTINSRLNDMEGKMELIKSTQPPPALQEYPPRNQNQDFTQNLSRRNQPPEFSTMNQAQDFSHRTQAPYYHQGNQIQDFTPRNPNQDYARNWSTTPDPSLDSFQHPEHSPRDWNQGPTGRGSYQGHRGGGTRGYNQGSRGSRQTK